MVGTHHRGLTDLPTVTLDWSKIGAGATEPLLRPRDIYAALASRPWPYLRQEQGEVLEKWYARKDDRDVVIKQNTGGGKTVAGLLIAQSCLNEGVGKAVYLAPDTYLAGRVREEAGRLGLAVTDDLDDPDFWSQKAILVTTFQKLVNGRSRFGVVGDGREPIELGVIVVDDAHTALSTTESQFRLTIPKTHAAYAQLLDLLEADLREQSPKAWEDIQSGDYAAAQRMPFWAWIDKQDRVLRILHPHRHDDELKFEWPLIADALHLCIATVTSRAVEVQPPVLPIHMIPSFVNARRRVYLTATLADDSVLVTDLDADPALLVRPVTPGSAADLGERMILAPIALNRSLDDEAVRVLAAQFARGDRDGDGVVDSEPLNVVVLVPSRKAAAAWSRHADRILYVNDLVAGVADLRAGHVGLVVMVNKYDGVDLPHDACRLLVLDGVPIPLDGLERREATTLANSPTRRTKEVQRIEQGMGRGVRDVEDYCAVLLLGGSLAEATTDPRRLELFSPATRAQLALSRDIAAQLQGAGLDAVRTALGVCLDRDPQWVTRSRRALAEVRYADTGTVRPEAVAAREAFALAVVGQTTAAADRLQTVVNTITDVPLRGVVREQKASYLHHQDAAAAQQQLAVAVRENSMLLRPVAGVVPVQLRAAAVQGHAAAAFLGQEYSSGINLVLGVRALLEEIIWEEERTDAAEAAWERLGRHLGFASTRPERLYGTGPDNLWALSDATHAVTELKTGASGDSIAKKDVDQLGGSVRWHDQQHPGVRGIPVMLHPSRDVDRRGTVIPGMRVITSVKLDALKAAVGAYAVALADGHGRWTDNQAVAEQLAHGHLTAGEIIPTYSAPARAAR